MELFLLYIWLKLDTISVVCGLLGLFFAIYGVGHVLAIGNDKDYNKCSDYKYASDSEKRELDTKHKSKQTEWYHHAIGGAICTSLLWFTGLALPSQPQAAVLVAGHYALKMSESPEASKVMSVLRKKANEFLDAELAPKVTK